MKFFIVFYRQFNIKSYCVFWKIVAHKIRFDDMQQAWDYFCHSNFKNTGCVCRGCFTPHNTYPRIIGTNLALLKLAQPYFPKKY
jgi:hypothetical protein